MQCPSTFCQLLRLDSRNRIITGVSRKFVVHQAAWTEPSSCKRFAWQLQDARSTWTVIYFESTDTTNPHVLKEQKLVSVLDFGGFWQPAFTSAPEARRASRFCGCPTHAAFAQALLRQAGNKTKTLALHLRWNTTCRCWQVAAIKSELLEPAVFQLSQGLKDWETVRFCRDIKHIRTKIDRCRHLQRSCIGVTAVFLHGSWLTFSPTNHWRLFGSESGIIHPHSHS